MYTYLFSCDTYSFIFLVILIHVQQNVLRADPAIDTLFIQTTYAPAHTMAASEISWCHVMGHMLDSWQLCFMWSN